MTRKWAQQGLKLFKIIPNQNFEEIALSNFIDYLHEVKESLVIKNWKTKLQWNLPKADIL